MAETTRFLLSPRRFPSTSSLHHNPSRFSTSHVIHSFSVPNNSSTIMFFARNRRLHLQLPKKSPFDGNVNLIGRNSDVLRRSRSKKSNFIVCASPKDSCTSDLVPMKEFPFFLAQFTTFGYVVIYFSILRMRYAAGIVTNEMMALPKSRFVAIGILEALGVASGMSAAAMLPGQAIPILNQEFVFIDAAKRLKGKSLDIFVVNSFGSGFQALFIFLLLPFLSNLKGIPFVQLPSYLRSGAGCFLNIGASIPGCDGAPMLPLLYIVSNIFFNISVLNIVKTSSAVVASLVIALSVPITIYVLSIPLPYLPGGVRLSPFFLLGSMILVFGLVLYNIRKSTVQ